MIRRKIPLLISLGLVCIVFLLIKFGRVETRIHPSDLQTHSQREDSPGTEVLGSHPIDSFDEWVQTAPPASGSHNWTEEDLQEGIALARERGAAMRELMRRDPDAALEAALGYKEYAQLPKEIQVWVEEPFSEAASLEVQISCGMAHDHEAHHSHLHHRLVDEARKTWEVFLPEKERVGLTKDGIPLQGIRLDGRAVIRGSVFQVLSGDEAAFVASHWSDSPSDTPHSYATGQPIKGEGLLAVSGGRIFHFQDEAEKQKVEAALREADQLPGRNVGSQWILRTVSADGFPYDRYTEEMQAAAYESTTGAKTALFILVDFPDRPGLPINAATLEQIIDVNVNNALSDYSYEATSMDATVYEGPIRVNSNSGDYLGDTNGDGFQDTPKDDDDLHDEAIANYMTAVGTATNPNSIYDTVAIYFTDIGYSWGGRASVGGQRMWIEDSTSDELILHEFGHNFGLRHANYWVFDATNGASTDPVDPSGQSEEYGDDFDVMGDGSTTEGHFHMGAKQFLGWIENNEWDDLTTAADNGTYRIYRFDDPASNSGLQAIRINKSDTGDHYWLGYRYDYASLPSFKKGAYMVWERASGNTFRNQSWLVDTTPGSINGKDDAPITLGRTYADSASDVYITPVAVGGSTPDEYIDVVVNFGPFPGNSTPSGSISGPDSTEARQLVLFSASVSDSDGDPLAYSWDMGDGIVKESSSTITHSWSIGGSYQVALTVSDMKGGSVTLTKDITVNDSLSTWNSRTSGTDEDLNGIAANDTHVVAVGDNNTILRSSDGTTWTDVSPPGFNNNDFNDIHWTSSEFIAVGQDYDFDPGVDGWEGIIYTSPAGETWTRAYETDTAETELNGVAYDGSSTLVAVGESATIVRKNAANAWTSINTDINATTHILEDVAFGDGNFILVGYDNSAPSDRDDVEVRTSADGLTWTDRSGNTGMDSWKDFMEIEFMEGAFHASGFYAHARRSTDAGQSWSTTQSGDRYQLDGFASIDGVHYAVGRNRDNSDSDVDLVSNDGIAWTVIEPGALPDRYELVSFNRTFISVGDYGSIRQSGIVTASAGYDSYTDTYFPGGGSDADEGSNPDLDWADNLLEYALGGQPDSASDTPDPPTMYFDGSDYAVFEITRDEKLQDVAYSVWWSQDLVEWTQAGLVVIEDSATALTVRTDQTFDQLDKAFFRLQVDR